MAGLTLCPVDVGGFQPPLEPRHPLGEERAAPVGKLERGLRADRLAKYSGVACSDVDYGQDQREVDNRREVTGERASLRGPPAIDPLELGRAGFCVAREEPFATYQARQVVS